MTRHATISTPALATHHAAPKPADQPLRLVCSEIRGGNRLIDTAIELPGIRGRLFSRPCDGGRGGDVHYLSVCGSGLLSRMCLADVVGHGAAVARVSSEMHALLRRFMNQPDQRRVLHDLNRRLEQIGLRAMTTAAALTYYAPHRRLTFSYAGHPPGWYFSAAQRRWSRLALEKPASAAGRLFDLPLAVDASAEYTRTAMRVNVGDRLLLVTDGVLEAPGPGGELFGERRVDDLLAGRGEPDCDGLAADLLDALRRHAGGELAHDDVTLLVAEFVPSPDGPVIWQALRNRMAHAWTAMRATHRGAPATARIAAGMPRRRRRPHLSPVGR